MNNDRERRLDESFEAFKSGVSAAIDESKREILRAVDAFNTEATLRMQRIEWQQQNFRVTTTERMNRLGKRIFGLEREIAGGNQ